MGGGCTLYVYDFYCLMFIKKLALKCVENVLIVNINLKYDAKTPPCSMTTNDKGKGGGQITQTRFQV